MLRGFESLGAAVCVSRPTLDGRSVSALWSASAAVLDLLASSGELPMTQALLASCARDKVLTALGLRPGLPIGDIVWATALSRTSVIEVLPPWRSKAPPAAWNEGARAGAGSPTAGR